MKIRTAALVLTLAASAAAHADNTGPWTQQDIKKLCYGRAGDDKNSPRLFDRCMNRNKYKLGRPKNPGEASELDKADQKLDAKAALRKAEEKTGKESK